jgi:hypothetical protein
MPDFAFPAAGWAWPALARKAHYFDQAETTSLCGRWMFLGQREPDNGPSRDDCTGCRRKLEARADAADT